MRNNFLQQFSVKMIHKTWKYFFQLLIQKRAETTFCLLYTWLTSTSGYLVLCSKPNPPFMIVSLLRLPLRLNTSIWIVTGSQTRLEILRLFMKLTMYNVVIMIRSRNWLMVVAIFGLNWIICRPSFSIWIDSTNEEYLKVNMTTGIDLLLWLQHHLLTCNWTILDRSFA